MVFESFRKRQKQILAGLVGVAMLTFIAGDFVSGCGRNRRIDTVNPIYGTVWGKDVHRSDLEQLESEKASVRGVIGRVLEAVGDDAKPELAGRVVGEFPWQSLQYYGVDWRLAYLALEGKADRLGLTVTDEECSETLMRWTNAVLTRQQLIASLAPKKAAEGRRRERGEALSERELFRLLARDLKVNKALVATTTVTSYDDPPLDLWRRVQDAYSTIGLEVARIPTAKFVDATTEPRAKELEEVFDKYKGRTADPEREVIGFRTPAFAEFEYVAMPVDKWADEQKVTEAELKKYYDENKLEFREEPKPPAPEKKADPPKSDPKNGPKKADEKAPAKDAPKTTPPAKSEAPKPAPTEKSAPKSEKKDEKKTGMTTPTGLGLAGLLANTGTLALQEKPAAKDAPKPAPAKADAPKTEPKKTEPAKSDGKAPAKADEKKMADKRKEPPPPPTPPIGSTSIGDNIDMKFKPFEAVKGEIEKKLKRQKARDMLREKVRKLVDDELKPYADKYVLARRAFQADLKTNDPAEMDKFVPPAPPRSFEAIAKEFRGEHKKVGPIAERPARKLDGVGKVLGFVDSVFDPQRPVFAIQSTADIFEDVYYIYWKTKFTPEIEPELAAVRDQVMTIWRKEQAEKPATKLAEELAEKVRKTGSFAKGLEGTEYKSFVAKEFRRANYLPGAGNAVRIMQRQRLPLQQLEGIPDAKTEFLNKASELELNEVAVVRGSEGENVYIVKCIKRTEPDIAEFAFEYEGVVKARDAQAQQYVAERYFPATAGRVLLESGYSAPKASDKKGDADDAM